MEVVIWDPQDMMINPRRTRLLTVEAICAATHIRCAVKELVIPVPEPATVIGH